MVRANHFPRPDSAVHRSSAYIRSDGRGYPYLIDPIEYSLGYYLMPIGRQMTVDREENGSFADKRHGPQVLSQRHERHIVLCAPFCEDALIYSRYKRQAGLVHDE